MRWRGFLVLTLSIILAVGFWALHVYYLNHTVEFRVLDFQALDGKLDWVITTPLSVVLLSLLALTFVVMLSLKLLSLILFFPSHLRTWKKRWAEKRRNKFLAEGLQAMVLGIRSNQYKNFLAAGDAGVAPATTYFLAAAMTSDTKRQTSLLRKAARADGDPMVKAMATAQARLLANQPAEAAEVLRIAGAATHKAIQPMKLLLEANEKSGDIRGAIDVANHLLERESSPALRHRIGQLTRTLLAEAGSVEDIHGLLGNVHKSSSSPNTIAVAAAKRLGDVNDKPGASSILEQALKQSIDAELLDAIATYGNDELVRTALKKSESHLQQNIKDTAMLRSIAELSLRQKLWGNARKMLEKCITIKEERETYLRLAKLAEAEGLSLDEANRLYRMAAQSVDPE